MANEAKIYFITGVCGSGKTTALSILKTKLSKDKYDLHDLDERGVPAGGGRPWRFAETKYWVEIGRVNAEKEITTIVSGFARPSEMEELAPNQENIKFILLYAGPDTLEKRIQGRYPTEESRLKFQNKHNKTIEKFVEENVNFTETMKKEALEYGSEIIDTNQKTPDEVVEEIIKIV